MQCHACQKDDSQGHVERCAVCHRGYCEEHNFMMSGRKFCSRFCAEYFFFEAED